MTAVSTKWDLTIEVNSITFTSEGFHVRLFYLPNKVECGISISTDIGTNHTRSVAYVPAEPLSGFFDMIRTHKKSIADELIRLASQLHEKE